MVNLHWTFWGTSSCWFLTLKTNQARRLSFIRKTAPRMLVEILRECTYQLLLSNKLSETLNQLRAGFSRLGSGWVTWLQVPLSPLGFSTHPEGGLETDGKWAKACKTSFGTATLPLPQSTGQGNVNCPSMV